MSYRVEDIESRLRSGEDSGWEFKQVEFAGARPKRPTCSDWADAIAALANATGGVVLAGVSDDGDIIGLSRAQIASLDSLLVDVSSDTIEPPVRINIAIGSLESGGRLLEAPVTSRDKPLPPKARTLRRRAAILWKMRRLYSKHSKK